MLVSNEQYQALEANETSPHGFVLLLIHTPLHPLARNLVISAHIARDCEQNSRPLVRVEACRQENGEESVCGPLNPCPDRPQAAFSMIKKLAETCISQQDHIGRWEKGKKRGGTGGDRCSGCARRYGSGSGEARLEGEVRHHVYELQIGSLLPQPKKPSTEI